MNGVEACREILNVSKDTKIVFMTAYEQKHPLVGEAQNICSGNLLHKPFKIADLLTIL